jgi:hypothetical protein
MDFRLIVGIPNISLDAIIHTPLHDWKYKLNSGGQ